MARWFLRRGDRVHGPLSTNDLRRLARAGKIAASDRLRREDQDDWIEARALLAKPASRPTPPARDVGCGEEVPTEAKPQSRRSSIARRPSRKELANERVDAKRRRRKVGRIVGLAGTAVLLVCIAGAVLAWLVLSGLLLPGIRVPEGGGTDSVVVEGVEFRNFDAATDLDLVKVAARKQHVDVTTGMRMGAREGFRLFRVGVRDESPENWVFVWPDVVASRLLQGIRSNWAGVVHRSNSSVVGGHRQLFALADIVDSVYVAVVEQPSDAATAERARAFLDEAVARGRILHHGRPICALMRALDPPDAKWDPWLEEICDAAPEDLARKSHPESDDPTRKALRGLAIDVQIEAAGTQWVLSRFRDADHLEPWLRAEQTSDATWMMVEQFAVEHDATPEHLEPLLELRARAVSRERVRTERARLLHALQPDELFDRLLAEAELPARERSLDTNGWKHVHARLDSDPVGSRKIADRLAAALADLDAGAPAWDMMIYALRAADPDRAAAIARRGRPAKSHGFSDLDTGKIDSILWHGDHELGRELIADGAQSALTDERKAACLLVATKDNLPAIAKLWIELGADPNTTEEEEPHRTPLIMAVQRSRFALVRALLESGAHVERTDGRGRRAIRYAENNVRDDGRPVTRAIRDLLLEHGARPAKAE